ncbi:hypothetical protein OH456_06515 [Vibrio sp. La 4.2.2]|uniref:hypothetical protein n=1 Tax=Vibrio sp. La 4.2.2 TaxID=2998830 RepID=UPI0022CDE5AF|nr:hypothetical protein [Vibrio sp. La 4.2.2]MDA0107788.1 hypothetical protein [Vibrio sp. La 4.2.2]
MSYSITDVVCKECGTNYQAALNGVFQVNGEYAATCTACNKQTFFSWGIEAASMVATSPKNASPVYFVKVL